MTAENKALQYLTIHEAHKLIQSGALSPVELTRAIVERIDAVDGQLHAFVNLMADTALEEARIAEAEILRGNYRGPMHGIPLAVKDQPAVKEAPAGIRGLDASAAKQVGDATAVNKLREGGAPRWGISAIATCATSPRRRPNPGDPSASPAATITAP